MTAYQLVPAVGTTDAAGVTTFTNRPAGAPLFYLDDNGGWVPVGEAAPPASQQPGGQQPSGPAYSAGAGIDLTGNVISATDYTDAEVDALLVPKISKQDADKRYGQLAAPNQWDNTQTYTRDLEVTTTRNKDRIYLAANGISVGEASSSGAGTSIDKRSIQFSDGTDTARVDISNGKLRLSGLATEVAQEPTTGLGIANKDYVDRAVAAGGTGTPTTGTPTTGTSYTDTQAVTAVANALVSANSQHTGIKASVVNGLPTLTVAPPRQPFVSVHPVGTVTTGETPIVLSEWTGVYLNLTSLNLVSAPQIKVNGVDATFPLTLNLGDILRITATVGGGGPGIVRLIPAP